MAANAKPIFVKIPRSSSVKMSSAATDDDGGGSTLLFQADATNGSRIHAITAVPVGSIAAIVVRLFIKRASVYYLILEKTCPAYTEAGGTQASQTNLLDYVYSPFLDPTDPFISLGPAEDLYVSLLTSPASAIHITAFGGDY